VPCTSSGCLVRMHHHQHTRAAPPRGDGDVARKRKPVTDEPALVPIDLAELQPAITPLQPKLPSTTIRDFKDFNDALKRAVRSGASVAWNCFHLGTALAGCPFRVAVLAQSRRARRRRLCLA
jgi:hypothetical protein